MSAWPILFHVVLSDPGPNGGARAADAGEGLRLTEFIALLGICTTVALALITFLANKAAARREREAQVYADALRAVEDYLEGPYRIRRRDGSAEARMGITTWLSEVKSRHNYYTGLLRLHSSRHVADAYDDFVAAAVGDAGPQMTEAWGLPPTNEDREVPLGFSYPRANADAAKERALGAMGLALKRPWFRPRRS